MKKRIGLLTLLLTLVFVFPAFAGQWREDMNGRWFENDDATFPKSGWHWVDGNGDGWAECYYFGPDGYVVTGRGRLEGFEISPDGAWIEDGVIQKKEVGLPSGGEQREDEAAEDAYWKALVKMESENGVDLDYQFRVHMEHDGRQEDLEVKMRLWAENINSDESQVFRMDMGLKEGTNQRSITRFSKDGDLYVDIEGEKIKLAQDEDAVYSSLMEALELVLDARAFGAPAVMRYENGNVVIDYEADINEIGTNTDRLLGITAERLTGYSYSDRLELTGAKGKAVINGDGYLTSEGYRLDALVYNDQVKGPIQMTAELQIHYNQPGQTVRVPIPSLDGYDED